MNIEEVLRERSGSVCELRNSTDHLRAYQIPPASIDAQKNNFVCNTCYEQITDPGKMDPNY